MNRRAWCWYRGVLLLSLLVMAGAAQAACVESTAALESMERRPVQFSSRNGEDVRFTVRIAANRRQRAAGMQHLCEQAVRDNPMLFRFPRPVQHAFHMQNVHVPLDILFIDRHGVIRSRQRMIPGEALYRPDHPFHYALEMLAGEAERLGLAEGMQLRSLRSD
ncbi:DUF192 domain-containing protein [Methylonatrum kenyense]|uniref:DUF192 domain-containing protein n=1 Tax=Methylonatrum kenyense TaxID=455253 RepID=UPI0020C0DDF3|nr:DUF192 domain-containing protein [Methylonatrum kenyense]MCK8515803.1 DUF192 domain-containing protein [Methylonatrum kenyense]